MAQQPSGVEQSRLLKVYTPYRQAEYTAIPRDAKFQVLRTRDQWSFVRFSEPSVPVWASSDFLFKEQGLATIIVDRLNLRAGSRLDSPILGNGERGYQSSILDVENGFAKIYAPTSIIFALRTSDLDNRVSSLDAAEDLAAAEDDLTVSDLAIKQRDPRPPTNQQQTEEPVQLGEQLDIKSDSWRISPPIVDRSGANANSVQPKADSAEPIADPTVLEPEPTAVNSSRDSLHRLSPGDTISLRVFGEDDLSVSNVRIPQSGSVSFPLIGSYNVVGKSVEELENQLREVLAQGYVRNPRLSISIDSYRPIFVLGAAQSIGSFPYTEGLTIAKAIAVAGGSKNSAKKDGVSVLRDGQVVEEGLAIDSTIEIRPGDIISIEEEVGVDAEGGSYVYLHGEVRSPGEYKFRRGLTVEKAVVLAGGFTLRASRKKVSVSRIVEGQDAPSKLKKVDLHMPIEPGDIIDVGASWF